MFENLTTKIVALTTGIFLAFLGSAAYSRVSESNPRISAFDTILRYTNALKNSNYGLACHFYSDAILDNNFGKERLGGCQLYESYLAVSTVGLFDSVHVVPRSKLLGAHNTVSYRVTNAEYPPVRIFVQRDSHGDWKVVRVISAK